MRRLDNDKEVFNSEVFEVDDEKNIVTYKMKEPLGEGTMKSYQVLKGIEVVYSEFSVKEIIKSNYIYKQEAIEFNYCLSGKMEALFKNKKRAFMNEGDVSIFGCKTNVQSCDFTQKPFKGISIMIYLKDAMEDIINFTGLKQEEINDFMAKVIQSQTCIITNAGKSLNHIFKEFYVFPEKNLLSHMRLKVMELVLYLIGETDYDLSFNNYFMESFVDRVDKAREILIEDLKKHITIEELSEQVGVNTTDLKRGFKSIYGDTIYAYLRKNRLEKARELLSESNSKIIDIASMVGYSNASKFSSAFKKNYGVTPYRYRVNK